MPPLSNYTITHGLIVFNGVREPQAVCQVAQKANRSNQNLSKSMVAPIR